MQDAWKGIYYAVHAVMTGGTCDQVQLSDSVYRKEVVVRPPRVVRQEDPSSHEGAEYGSCVQVVASPGHVK